MIEPNKHLGDDALTHLEKLIEEQEAAQQAELTELRAVLAAEDIRKEDGVWTKPNPLYYQQVLLVGPNQPKRIPIPGVSPVADKGGSDE